VGFATCLEALFCTDRKEITRQLTSPLSWLLESKDCANRRDIFKEATRLCDLRCRIVHGAAFKIRKLEGPEGRLSNSVSAFWRILEDQSLFDTFFSTNPKICDDYLNSLPLERQNNENA
jgi:hypothetical protein